ncbi:unnamed protein product [Ectocarpus sp. CCAP 1310/34]|nr:unnamed protein product [Ectocarpus sp. CCAP 1310/34]
MATSAPASGRGVEVKQVTISPATSNPKLEFVDNFEQAFKSSSSLSGAFEHHVARGPDTTKLPGKVVAISRTTHQTGLSRAPMGLISAIMTAYNTHCALVVSPDDVWLTILSQFCAYVNKNAEGLRDRVVEHEGKKKLTVYGQNIKPPELADWFLPGFSTTTETDEVCAAATAMASLQEYFNYEMCLRCGIPSVALMGTVEDWKLLREKIERMLEFEVLDNPEGKVMELWVGYLRKVCDGFVESAEHPNSAATVDFWDKVFSHRHFVSGVTFTTGWVSAFSCFDKDGNFIGKNTGKGGEFPLVTSLCHNVVSCPVAIDDNGYGYDATLVTGQVAYRAERGAKAGYPTMCPRNDWCLAVAVK